MDNLNIINKEIKRNNFQVIIFSTILIFMIMISSLFSINLNILNYIMIFTSFVFMAFLIHYKILSRRLKNGKSK